MKGRGGSRIFLRRGAPLRNDVTDLEVKKFKSKHVYTKTKTSSQGGAHPLHPSPRSAPERREREKIRKRKGKNGWSLPPVSVPVPIFA